MRELLGRFAPEAVLQVEVALQARAGHGLIGRIDHALEPIGVLERLERDHRLDGRAVGVGDDALFAVAADGVRVHLRHDERHVRIHAPAAGIVDHHGAGRRGDGGEVLRGARAGGEQGDIDVQPVERVVGQLAHGVFPAHEGQRRPGAALGREQEVLRNRELALLEHLQKFSADHARRTDDGDPILFHNLLHHFHSIRPLQST